MNGHEKLERLRVPPSDNAPPPVSPPLVLIVTDELARPELLRVPLTVGVSVNAPPVLVMLRPVVSPLNVALDVASDTAPVCAVPYVCASDSRPVFVMVRPEPIID